MVEAIALAQKIGALINGTLLALILIGSYYKIWVWGRDLSQCRMDHEEDIKEIRADYEKRLDEAAVAKTKWESIAISATGLATHGVALAERRKGVE